MDDTVYTIPNVMRAIEHANRRAPEGGEETYIVWARMDGGGGVTTFVLPEGEIMRGCTAIYSTDEGNLL